MKFEYDPRKSVANRKKHGIDFDEARSLWDDPDLIEIPVRTSDEPRYLIIARYSCKYWSCIVTYRSERIRIISVRRSRREEVELYEGS